MTNGFSVVAAGGGVQTIYLYSEIGGVGVTADAFQKAWNALPKNTRAIELRINSPGGNVFEASAIYTLIAQSKIPTFVFVDGMALSAASYIAMAGDTIKPWSACTGPRAASSSKKSARL